MRLARPLENLVDQLQKLPTIGPKTAQRLALFILRLPEEETREIARAMVEARVKVFPCPRCGYLTDSLGCPVCDDKGRDASLLCIAEDSSDLLAIERAGYRGQYHVLNRHFGILEGQSLEDLDMTSLQARLAGGDIKEVILALNPDIDGEIMSRYLAGAVTSYGVKVTRLAHGLPVGGDIEYTDEITLRKALEGRKEI